MAFLLELPRRAHPARRRVRSSVRGLWLLPAVALSACAASPGTPVSRFLFEHGGKLVTLDSSGGAPASAWSAQDQQNPLTFELSADGETLAYCGSGASDHGLYAGRRGAPTRILSAGANYCNGAWLDPNSPRVAWIEQSTAVSGPKTLLRLVGLDGAPLAGDAQVTADGLWGAKFWDGQVLTLVTQGDDVGPLFATRPEEGLRTQLSSVELRHPFELGLGGRVIAASGRSLALVEAATGATTQPFTFPWEAPCVPRASAPESNCYLLPANPVFSADAQWVAFEGRGDAALTSDTEGDIFLLELSTGALRRVTNDAVRDEQPRFTADGQWLYWIRSDTLVRRHPDGDGQALEEVVPSGVTGPLRVAWEALGR